MVDVATFQEQWTALDGCKILILQNEVPDAVNLDIARVAQVVINAAPARELSQDLANQTAAAFVSQPH